MLGWIIIWLFVLFHHLKKFATETSICFLFPFSSQIALLSVLFSFPKTFHFFSFEISHHQCSPCHLAYRLLSSLLRGKYGPIATTFWSNRKKLCQGCDPLSGGRKAHSGPATHWPPTLLSSALSTVLGLDELIHSPSTRRVQWEETFCKSKK